VLVFALAQGLFWAGIVSTFLMGLRIAIRVAAIATLAVGAKALAKRVAGKPIGYGDVFMRGFEFGAAGLVLAFGVLLLTGYAANERLAGFSMLAGRSSLLRSVTWGGGRSPTQLFDDTRKEDHFDAQPP
jgi:hypothetical protein